MKKIAFFLVGIAGLAFSSVMAEEPRGTLLELHSCELYAGGCVVSSEATLDGRYMLRAWNFNGGQFGGQDLSGLQVALAQCSAENLAAEQTTSERAMVYLPKNATDSQRAALLAWLKSTAPDLKSANLQTRIVPLKFSKTSIGYAFSAGHSVSVKTAPQESCDTFSCGETLWYSPRSASSVFTVAVNRASRVDEPALQLKWDDGGTHRSIFLARFGDQKSSRNAYVTTADLCGPTQSLF